MQADAVRQHDAEEHRQHLAEIGRQQVAQELSDVREDRAALFNRRDDRRKVVIGQHHVGRFFRHVGACDAHRHADICFLQSRRIVHPISRHGHDGARTSEGVDDPQFVLGVNARVDRHLCNGGRTRFVRQLLEFRTGYGATVFRDAKFLSDDGGGARVIASDHERTNPGASRSRNRFSGFGPRRIDHTDQSGEHHVLFDASVQAIGKRRERIAR